MTKGAMGNAQENMYTFMPFPKPAMVRAERVTGEMEDKPEPEQVCSVPAAETASAEGKNSACWEGSLEMSSFIYLSHRLSF